MTAPSKEGPESVDPRLLHALPGSGHALFTARAHGNMSSVGGVQHEYGHDARERLRAKLGLRRLARGYQVHGTTVLCSHTDAGIPSPNSATAQPPVEADGQATSVAGIGAMVLTADCLPVALGTNGAVAMVHAGWRGLAAGVLEEGVRAVRELGGGDMKKGAGEDDERIVAIIGPAAGPCCYEVGEEVHTAFGHAHRVEGPRSRNIDLKAIARDKLLAVGVTEIQDLAMCTICDERFFSYRREGARAGRQGGVAWLS